jgi:polyisoprenoid-binding protein YceI
VFKHGKFLIVASIFAITVSACGLLRDPESASGPIEVIPLEDPTEAPEIAETAEISVESPTDEPMSDAGSEELIIAQISQDGSEVRFELDEDLRGARNIVIGTTNQVSGEIAINPSDISQSRVGVILINARTFVTDNEFRNRAIQNEILDTGDFEFISFEPSEIIGLPSSGSIGDEFQFSIIGNLTIRDISQSVTFDVTVTVESETRMVGSASAVINRVDFGLNIPSVPNVANVEEDVELYIDFIANRS